MNCAPAVGDVMLVHDENGSRKSVKVLLVHHDVWPERRPRLGDTTVASHRVNAYVEDVQWQRDIVAAMP